MILLNFADWRLLSCDGWFYVIISQLMIWTHLIRQTLHLAHTNQDSPTQDLYRLTLFITTRKQLLQTAQYVIITRVLRLAKWQISNYRKEDLTWSHEGNNQCHFDSAILQLLRMWKSSFLDWDYTSIISSSSQTCRWHCFWSMKRWRTKKVMRSEWYKVKAVNLAWFW